MAIGIDVGRSGTKFAYVAPGSNGAAQVHAGVIPSAFAPAGQISMEVAAKAAEPDTVEVGGRLYWIGETAIKQGRDEMVAGLDDRWVSGPKHEALLKAALKRVEAAGVPVRGQTVVVGLPSRGFAESRQKYQARAMEIAGGAQIRVVPQSMGPYYSMLFDDNGNELPGVGDKCVVIIEVGQFTTDLAQIDRNVPIESALESTDGMRLAAEGLIRAVQREHELVLSLVAATNALATGRIKNFARELDVSQLVQQSVQPVADRIAEKIQQVFGSGLRDVDQIILAGGGATLLQAPLLARLGGADISISEEPRFAVARGFLRAGLAMEKLARQSVSAATEAERPAVAA